MLLVGLGGFISIGLALAILIFVISVYNQLVVMRVRVRNSWAQVDVQLKRRYDLIPNLVSIVKAYASHEKELFEEVTKARALGLEANQTGSISDASAADFGITGAISRLMVVKEAYPDLKANTNFLELMAQLDETEDKISFSRQFYNDTVLKLNTKIQLFPSNMIAGMFGIRQAEFFSVSKKEERESVNISM